jgi:hypothetical protein
MATNATPTPPPTERKKHRSPAYPAIGLKLAIERAEQFYEHERRNAASLLSAASHWGYGLKSSGLLTTVAALKSFGLLDELEGATGTSRTVKLSDLGLRIVLDKRPDSQERSAAIKQAALLPKIHSALWIKYNGNLPSDVELRHRLIFDWKFNDNIVEDFIREFRNTISFAKLSESDNISPGHGGSEHDEEISAIKVGDFVQWESQGVLQFEAKRVREITEDGEWAYVDGSNTGLPMDELSLVDPPVQPPPPRGTAPRPRTMVEAQHMAGEITPPTAGRTPVGSDIPVSANCIMGVSATGLVTQTGIEKLIAYLQLIKGSFPKNGRIGTSVAEQTDDPDSED